MASVVSAVAGPVLAILLTGHPAVQLQVSVAYGFLDFPPLWLTPAPSPPTARCWSRTSHRRGHLGDTSLCASVRPLTVSRVSNRISTYESWQRLLDGNERFVTGDSLHPNQNASRRSELVNTQNPFAVIFGCADSRLAAEIIFDVGLGDVFVVRTAGHVIDDAVLGSLEYAFAYSMSR